MKKVLHIGDNVTVPNIHRCLTYSGYIEYVDPPLENVQGKVVAVADFVFRKVCVEFTRTTNFQQYTVWKDEQDVNAA